MTQDEARYLEPAYVPGPEEIEEIQRSLESVRLMRFWRITAAILLGGSLGAYLFFRIWAGPPPLISDDFPERGVVNGEHWGPMPEAIKNDKFGGKDCGIRGMAGSVRLKNRGYLVTRREFAQPVSITFDWQYQMLEDDPKYADVLSVVLRTDGVPEPLRPFECQRGVRINFRPFVGDIAVARIGDEKATVFSTERIQMSCDTWMSIRIEDDGRQIRVFVFAPGENSSFEKKPAAVLDCPPRKDEPHRIAFYNREWVSCSHVSFLRHFRLCRLDSR